MARGKINNRKRSQQINDFSGLVRHRNITPTDIDGVIDYKGNAFIYFEGKYKDKIMDRGQELALENICKSHNKNGRRCYVILFRHEISDPEQDIPVHECMVERVYSYNRQWVGIKNLTVLNCIDRLEMFLREEGVEL